MCNGEDWPWYIETFLSPLEASKAKLSGAKACQRPAADVPAGVPAGPSALSPAGVPAGPSALSSADAPELVPAGTPAGAPLVPPAGAPSWRPQLVL